MTNVWDGKLWHGSMKLMALNLINRDEKRQHEKALKMLKTLLLNMNMTFIF